jgi:hypothetical protein
MGSTPTAAELDGQRQEYNKWLPDAADIHRDTFTKDEYGGRTPVDEVIAASVPCSLSYPVLPGTEEEVANQQVSTTDSVISLAYGTDIEIDDRVVIVSQHNKEYDVLYVIAEGSEEIGVQIYARSKQK